MYLKSLKLTGFKSFADRTRLEYRPGVTVIVGPNGSGKSNVVDALAWVMGTQSTKNLRTSKMDDVIFAGTATRPALGRAEVTLVLDNESRMLPLDLPEVSITRRLYRDGSSDYEINGVSCRLLDIQELLSDSGVGRHQHVIVGQGQVSSVLNATPEEHRAVIEEAAGILKHRTRKDKAIRRLERTDGDVVRLHDLLGEISKRMRPLKRQAAAAARHDEIAGSVQRLRLWVGGSQLRRIDDRSGEIRRLVGAAERSAAAAETERERVARELAGLRAQAGDLGEALDRDTAAAARAETVHERLRRIGQVAEERRRAAQARIEGADERRRDLDEEASDLVDRIAAAEENVAALERLAEDAERGFRRLEDEAQSLTDQEEMSTEGAIAVVRGDLRSSEMADERDRRESESLSTRLLALGERIGTERQEREAVNADIRDVDELAAAAQSRYTDAEAARQRAQSEWEEAEAEHTGAQLSVAAASARRDALVAAADGLSDTEAREIVEAAAGARGSVAAALDVPEHLAPAVDAALGPWSDGIVFGSADDVVAAIAAVKGAGRGGVSVVRPPLGAESVEPVPGTDRLVDLLGSGADRSLAEALLGDVLVTEGWQAAAAIADANPGVRVVTPEGDLIAPEGARIAHPDGASPAMIESAEVSLEQCQRDQARSASLLAQRRRVFDEARAAERDALETLESLEARLAGATEMLARLDRSIQANLQEVDRLEARSSSIADEGVRRAEQVAELRTRLAALEGEEAERQKAWEALVERRRAVAAERERARGEWQEHAAAHRAAVESLAMLRNRRGEVSRLIDVEEADTTSTASVERLAAIGTASRQAIEALRTHLDGLRARQAELRTAAGEAGVELGSCQHRHDELTSTITDARESLSTLAVEAAELRVRREQVAERLRRDADADEETALAATRPDIDGDLDAELENLEAELRRMGPINPLAAAEYAELSERHGFLSSQLEDLEASRSELRKVIEALDGEIGERFSSAFEEVAAAYERHFGVLFPGGAGQLRLTDPDDLLATGVEITAQPLGKKVAKMSLLSGGERSLAALAFLFAVFEARPSPFYVLDEVEAALDDANLHRFTRLLDAFRSDAQLIVVTHQQQTMEAADVLYGVTMEPGGSSTVVARTLTEAVETVG